MRALLLLALPVSLLIGTACDAIAIGEATMNGGGGGVIPSSGAAGNVSHAGAGGGDRSSGGVGGVADSGAVGGDAPLGGEPASGGQAGEAQSGDNAGGSDPGPPCSLELRGRVTAPRGAAIVGMTVTLSGQASAVTKTSIDGDYVFAQLCPGTYEVTPECGASAVELELEANQTLDFSNSAYGCEREVVAPRLLIVILDPTATAADVSPPQRLSTVLGLGAPADAFALKMMDAVTTSTNGHVRPNGRRVTGSLDFPALVGGFRYTPESFAACRSDAKNCSNESIDYAALDQELDLCDIVQSDNIDQVWVYGADQFNMPRVGALSCELWVGGQLQTQVLDVFGLRYDRGLSSFLADFQAAADAELWTVFPNLPGDPVNNPYGLFLQACGSLNLAPNSQDAGRFDETSSVESFCDAFLDYPVSPPLPLKSLSCVAWGCTEDGFRRYWFSRLPRARWFDSLGRHNDYWRSVLLNRHVATPPVGVTCSSSSERGSCSRVSDGQHGVCGVGEWAMQDQTAGWVEYQFSPPQSLSGIDIYDGACDGQVLAGQVEFSDGSEPIGFGALEASGADYTGFVFAPKLLSGLRVYVDQSSGYSPGFGEISLTYAPP